MKVSDEVWELVNFRKPTCGFLATADRDGRCNAACFGSIRFSDRGTMTMLLSENRTLENLRTNSHAVFVTARGENMEDVEGCRVYLEVKDITQQGPVIDKGRQMIAQAVGEEAAQAIKAFVTFEVTGVRPLVDRGVRS